MTAENLASRSYAVIVAAGSGRRCPGPRAKQFLELGGSPLYLWSVRAFAAVEQIAGIILVGPADDVAARAEMEQAAGEFAKVLAVVPGGATRTASVARGVAALAERGAATENDAVLIHDGARPLVTPGLIERIIAETAAGRAAVPVTTPTATVKRLAGEIIRETLPREGIGLAQTPQGVPFGLLRRALEYFRQTLQPAGETVTDEGSLIEALPENLREGVSIAAVPGESRNLKITFPEDLRAAEILLDRDPAPPTAPVPPYATGFGYDVHAFADGRRLVLGGIEIPGHAGLAGHSDADVLVHALVDAILGAIGEGDIGRHFPDHDPAYRDLCSLRFLEKAIALTRAKKRFLLAADVTVVAETPRLAPHIPAMQECLLRILGPCQLNLKATTTEGLGFTGRREGIAAYAVVTVAAS
jgi:2-C-methyl-D-erythritol 4-phosphate cytidylyltransferase/2-C-methyl-D-erythritol 2,4-cyclodiphosphate synthase